MKIVVIGGSGLIGSKLVPILDRQGHRAVAASPRTGVNALTGEGLAEALDGADVVVDVSNSPSFEETAAREFFQTSTSNLLAAEAGSGVAHHVALSVVGSDRMPDSGYMRAKAAQETVIAGAGVPYSIVRATQFLEFVPAIIDGATDGDTVRLPPVLIQPMAADDVAAALADVVVGPPVNGVVEIGGPEQFRLDELGRSTLAASGDTRAVAAESSARYFGALVQERTLVPADAARTGTTTFGEWYPRAAGRQ